MVVHKKKSKKDSQKNGSANGKADNAVKRSESRLEQQGPQLGAADVLALQRMAGNRQVERMLKLQRQEEEEKPAPVQSERNNPFETIHALAAYILQAQIEEAADDAGVDAHLVGAIFAHESAECGAFDGLANIESLILIPDLIEGGDLLITAWEWLTRDRIGAEALQDIDGDLLDERIELGQIIPTDDIELGALDADIPALFENEGLSPEEIALSLRAIIEQWKAAGVDLEGQHAVLASLYGEGQAGNPDFNRIPRPTTYGMDIIKAMLQVETLYALDS